MHALLYGYTTFALEYACPNPSWVLTAIPLSRPLISLQLQLEKQQAIFTHVHKRILTTLAGCYNEKSIANVKEGS